MFKTILAQQKLNNLAACLKNLAPPGCYLEIGVYQGATLAYLAHMFPERKFYGYDTFEGMPEAGPLDNLHQKGDFGDTSLELVQKLLSPYRNITLVKGYYPDSDHIDPRPIAQAHVDVDLYESTKAALEYLHPRMAPGSFLFCDDAFQRTTDGATIAFTEFAVKHNKIIRVADGVQAFLEY